MLLNEIRLAGNLGADAELRTTQNGKQCVKLKLAVNDKVGEEQRTTWFDVVVWNGEGGLAPFIYRDASTLTKGSHVYVEGRFAARPYERQDGTNGMALEVTARNVALLARVEREPAAALPPARHGLGVVAGGRAIDRAAARRQPATAYDQRYAGRSELGLDDIPF
jgi:single-strand DNA-binding protein